MTKTVGVVGLGNMGFGMAKNLLRAGFTVTGYDVRPASIERLVDIGGRPASSPADAGRDADAVVIMVMTADQVRSVIEGENGLLSTMRPGSSVILSATIGVAAARQIGELLNDHGIEILDTCVSGGLPGADAGALTLMAGGPDRVFEANLDVLRAVGDPEKITHVGPKAGDGQAVKACIQALIAVTYPGIFESLVLGAKLGIDADILRTVIGSSIVGSPLFRIASGHVAAREFVGTGSHISTMDKDITLTLAAARDVGAALPATAFAAQFLYATTANFPDEDCWAMAKLFEQLSGVTTQAEN